MFDKAKKIYEMQKQAKAMQKALASEVIEVEGDGGKIIMRITGEMKVVHLQIDYAAYGEDKDQLTTNLIKVYNKGVAEAQKISAEKMKSMGGLGALGDLLG